MVHSLRALALSLILWWPAGSAIGEDFTSCVLDEYPPIAAAPDPILWTGDEQILSEFGFRKTIDHILRSAGVAPDDSNAAALVTSLTRSFRAEQFVNRLSGVAQALLVRNTEASLTAEQLFGGDGLKPVALINRLDLVPASGAHCGEYRIVYELSRNQRRHFELIFEAALPNPTPGDSAGCRAVARFWRGLQGLALNERAHALEEFYYRGATVDGVALAPVVTAAHYGSPFGQVRSNTVLDSPWTLREWRIVLGAESTPSFVADTVKANPNAGFYGSGTGTSPFVHYRSLFQAQLLGSGANKALALALWAPELNSIPEVNEDLRLAEELRKIGQAGMPQAVILQSFGLPTGDLFNDGESQHSADDDPASMASPEFKQKLAAVLAEALQGNNLVDGTLARASALTCIGCHHPTGYREVGKDRGTLFWPDNRFFRHVGGGSPSDAMVNVFFPFRALQLAKALCGGIAFTATGERKLVLDLLPQQVGLDGSDGTIEMRRAIDQMTPGALSYFRRPH